MRFIRPVQTLYRSSRRNFSYNPPKGAAESDNSAFLTFLGLGTIIAGSAYVYYDPDVLPDTIKNILPIQKPVGHGMTLEEYEKWRASQDDAKSKQSALPLKSEKTQAAEAEQYHDEEQVPKPSEDVTPIEMRRSLERLLADVREQEAQFLQELKARKNEPNEEEKLMMQEFKDEKARLKRQLKFLKVSK